MWFNDLESCSSNANKKSIPDAVRSLFKKTEDFEQCKVEKQKLLEKVLIWLTNKSYSKEARKTNNCYNHATVTWTPKNNWYMLSLKTLSHKI